MNPRPTIMRLLAAALLASLAGGLFPAGIARAAGIVYVKPGGAGTKDGSSWVNAKDLQPALTAAAAGDQLWVAAGRYTPSATDRTASFALKSGVALYGGFAGSETQLNQRNVSANVTTLSGDLAGDDGSDFANNAENSYHVVTSTNTDSSAILDGFTIAGGSADNLNQYPLYQGGGLYNVNSSATLRNLTISGNYVIGSGGGIYNQGGAVSLLNVTVSGNRAAVNGGGLVNQGGALKLTNLVVSGNTAQRGGGMYNYASSPALTNLSVSGNSASQGGGVYNDPASSPQIRNSIFWGDSGGEIYNAGAPAPASYSIVQGGYAGKGNKNADPLFVTPVPPAPSSGGDLRLNLPSPAIDAGNSLLAGLPATDRAGNPRQLDVPAILDTGTDSPSIDIGAYEAQQLVLYVRAGASGQGTGTSWADAYPSLQSALAAALPGQAIWVAAGRYTPSATGNRNASFALTSGVALYGGFAGSETQLTERNVSANVTVLSGDLDGDDGLDFANNGENSYHVVTSTNSDSSAVLDGFTIAGGNANASGGYCPGAGCGGGMLNVNSSPSLTNVTISGNTAAGGGGIYNDASNPSLTNVTISGNSASQGGGMLNDDSSPSLNNVTISGNTTGWNGGGMLNVNSSSPSLTNATISGNTAGWNGGGMLNMDSSPSLTNVTVSGNSASQGGGAYNYASNPSLTNVTISGNSAGDSGAGMYNNASSPTLTNLTVSGNSASQGGGMYNDLMSHPQIRNSIFWGDGGGEIYGPGTVSFSIVQGEGVYPGTGNKNADPLFVTPVPAAPSSDGDLHLQDGSPAIDAGDGTLATLPATDRDGDPRRVDISEIIDTGIGDSPAVDLGAYEEQLNATVIKKK